MLWRETCDLLLIVKGENFFLAKISIHSSIIIHYIVEKNMFVVIVYMLSSQKKNWKVHIEDCFKIMINKKKINMLNSKILKDK